MPTDKPGSTASLLSSAIKRPYAKPVLVTLDLDQRTEGKTFNFAVEVFTFSAPS